MIRTVVAAIACASLASAHARAAGDAEPSPGANAGMRLAPRTTPEQTGLLAPSAMPGVAPTDEFLLSAAMAMFQGEPAKPTGGGSTDLAKQLSNPVANLISVPFQFNYDDGYGPNDAERFTLNIQPVIPFSISEEWNVITRTIVPVIYQDPMADGLDSEFGLGDTLQSFFFSPKDPIDGWILGAGPVALWPTGTNPALRSESLGLGPTFVALRQEHGFTYGALLNHVWSVIDSDDHAEVNSTFLQPFLSYTWPSATTIVLNTESSYDWTAEDWTVPLNLQLAQIVKIGSRPVQFQIGGRYYAESPDEGPEWGLRFAITFIFPK